MSEINGTIEYRLDSIEKTLTELKNVVVETRLQQRDINELMQKQKELLQAINSHDGRIRILETQPMKDRAGKWQLITDLIFKSVITAGIAYILHKVGL